MGHLRGSDCQPARSTGILECWNAGILGVEKRKLFCYEIDGPLVLLPIIPPFHHSIRIVELPDHAEIAIN
jgi:hypothetical protein